jgi:zinc transport system ATP-binding protein
MNTADQLLLKAENISVIKGERSILKDASLSLHAGEIVTLIGPNGAGKTTLVRVVLGLMDTDTGKVERKTKLRIGYMPQKLHIEPSLPLTVDRFLGLTTCEEHEKQTNLELTGVSHLRFSPMQSLSGGETQRVLLARALLQKPELLVLDEPVQGVDIAGQAKLYQLISQIRDERGCGVLMVSHDLHLVMASTDTVICLNQHVCCHGHPEKVSADPAYLELFGQAANASVAVYTHHHDHSHDNNEADEHGDHHA